MIGEHSLPRSCAFIAKLLCLAIAVLTIISDDTVRHFDTVTHSLGQYLYVNWWKLFGLNEAGPFGWLKFNTIEILILLTAASTACRYRALVITSELLLGVVFLLTVAAMFVYGALMGGDMEPALWQVRPFFHTVILAFLFLQAFRTADDLTLAIRVVVTAIVVKAVYTIGVFVFMADLQFSDWRELVGHEDSVFFVAALAFLFALFLYGGGALRTAWIAPTYLLVLAALVVNLRRAGYAAYGVSILMLPAILHQRHRLAFAATLGVIVAALIYLLLFWHSDSTLGIPAQKLLSSFIASDAEFYSNAYRYGENISLWRLVEDHPFGIGFGIPFEPVVPLSDLSAVFQNWRYHPHNMIFGLWMSLGTPGFIIFLLFFGTSIMSSINSIRRSSLTPIRCTAVFCSIGLSAALVVAYFDQFVWAQRGALFTGILIGLAAAIASLEPGRLLWTVAPKPVHE